MRRSALLAVPVVLLAVNAAFAQAQFRRGDSNLDGGIDISDGVNILNILFLGAPEPGCPDARDANDDGGSDISDGAYLLNHLFLGGPAPPAPFAACGCDETDDALGCDVPTDDCIDAGPCGEVVECFDQATLDAAIAKSVPPNVCIAPDAAELVVGDLRITVCPAAAVPAPMCEGFPGCAVTFDQVRGTLDIPGSKVDAFIAGSITAMPILIVNTALGTQQTCSVDVTFSGEAEIPLVTEVDGSGNLLLVAILPLVFDRDSVEIDLTARGGVLCSLLAGFQDLFVNDLIDQLDASAADLLVDLNAELAGQTLCAED